MPSDLKFLLVEDWLFVKEGESDDAVRRQLLEAMADRAGSDSREARTPTTDAAARRAPRVAELLFF